MADAKKATEQVAKGAEENAKKAGSEFDKLAKSAETNSASWTTAGTTLAGFGAATVGALGLATKAAMDWESSWAGVQKTVDGTAPQMEALESGLRGLARELPVTHQEIAGVAEAAGQLGIATPNIIDFTRTMVNMGVATNLSSEEAASSLARFINITGTSQNDIGKLGAAIVGLGN
ncbi:TPA: phage tail tape measure protein, partial [Shigella flexneri]|nr:phage tail tape measure protein [Shigella flexneri]